MCRRRCIVHSWVCEFVFVGVGEVYTHARVATLLAFIVFISIHSFTQWKIAFDLWPYNRHLNQNSHRGERECRGFTLSSLTLNGEWVNVLICEIYISVFFVRRRAETTSAILYNNNLIVQQQQQQQIIRVGNGGTRQRTTERITKTERKSRREREEKRKKKTYYK